MPTSEAKESPVPPVQFEKMLRYLSGSGYELFVEIGPKPTLIGMARQFADGPSRHWIPTLRQGVSEWERIADTVMRLYAQGVAIDR